MAEKPFGSGAKGRGIHTAQAKKEDTQLGFSNLTEDSDLASVLNRPRGMGFETPMLFGRGLRLGSLSKPSFISKSERNFATGSSGDAVRKTRSVSSDSKVYDKNDNLSLEKKSMTQVPLEICPHTLSSDIRAVEKFEREAKNVLCVSRSDSVGKLSKSYFPFVSKRPIASADTSDSILTDESKGNISQMLENLSDRTEASSLFSFGGRESSDSKSMSCSTGVGRGRSYKMNTEKERKSFEFDGPQTKRNVSAYHVKSDKQPISGLSSAFSGMHHRLSTASVTRFDYDLVSRKLDEVMEKHSSSATPEIKPVNKTKAAPFKGRLYSPENADTIVGTILESKGVSSEVESMNQQFTDIKLEKRKVIEYHGSCGSKIPVQVNCVKVKCRNEAVYQYNVSFSPTTDNKNLRFNLLKQHKDVIGNTSAFDGMILYLPFRLSNVVTKLVSKRITDETDVHLEILLVKAIDPASHLLIPFYNIVLRRCMKILKMCMVGRNYYDQACAQHVPKYKLQLWPGFVTAVREMEGGLMLNIDCSHKILRDETVLSVMHDIYQANKGNFKELCIKELVGSTVLTRYNNNNYRIDAIDWEMTPMSTFTTSKGNQISFVDYYKTQYRIDIQDRNQPMLINRPKRMAQRSTRVEKGEERMIALVPELCFITGLSERIAGDFRAMKDIGSYTRLNPSDRIKRIEQFLKRINSSPEAKNELLRWGLEIDTNTVSTSGRSLPAEKILVGKNYVFNCNKEADFFRDVSRSTVLKAVTINNWIMVFTQRDNLKAQNFVEKFIEVSSKVGMKVRPPKLIAIRDDRSDTFKQAIASSINEQMQLVVCLFPTARDDRYNAVKKLCCIEMPIPSQVILSKTLPQDPHQGKFRSVAMKIALQINCKLGGELWALDIPLNGLMVCGIDVFHEGKGGKGRSVAALVSSMNRLMTRWYSRSIVQSGAQEIIDALKHCFCETLRQYYEINHTLPERIVVYRDGVGDGQLNTVADHEVEQLRGSLGMFDAMAGGKYDPKLTIVVVSKRINTRFVMQSRKMLMNPPPGTVVDHTATRPNWPDFYLVSQHVLQGTVSPTHYIVINGHKELKPDHLQRLTYKLTFMYYNWPGTVRVPAPCQYAHKLAYLVGENLKKEPAHDLNNRLFYL